MNSKDILASLKPNNLNHELRLAAATGNLARVRELLNNPQVDINDAPRGINPNTGQPASGQTALHRAAMSGHAAVFMVLLEAGAKFLKDSEGKTALQCMHKDKQSEINAAFLQQTLKLRLEKIFTGNRLFERFKTQKKLRILSLGCGIAIEAAALEKILPGIEIEFTGIDNNQVVLDYSKQLLETLACKQQAQFIKADLTVHLTESGLLGLRGYDLLIIRQPNITQMPELTLNMLVYAQALANPRAYLFASSYHLQELTMFGEMAKQFSIPSAKGTYVTFPDNNMELEIEGHRLCPDQYSNIFEVSGLALEDVEANDPDNPPLAKANSYYSPLH